MGYFSNGTEGMMYEGKYCINCIREVIIHNGQEHGCPVWFMHFEYNYDECNNPDSLLHKMIPRNKEDTFNGKCLFFVDKRK